MPAYRGTVHRLNAGVVQGEETDGPLESISLVVRFEHDQGPLEMPPIGSTVTVEVSDSEASLVTELVRWATSDHSYGKTTWDDGAPRRMTNAEFLADGYGDETLSSVIRRATELVEERRRDGHG